MSLVNVNPKQLMKELYTSTSAESLACSIFRSSFLNEAEFATSLPVLAVVDPKSPYTLYNKHQLVYFNTSKNTGPKQ